MTIDTESNNQSFSLFSDFALHFKLLNSHGKKILNFGINAATGLNDVDHIMRYKENRYEIILKQEFDLYPDKLTLENTNNKFIRTVRMLRLFLHDKSDYMVEE